MKLQEHLALMPKEYEFLVEFVKRTPQQDLQTLIRSLLKQEVDRVRKFDDQVESLYKHYIGLKNA